MFISQNKGITQNSVKQYFQKVFGVVSIADQAVLLPRSPAFVCFVIPPLINRQSVEPPEQLVTGG